MPPEQGDQIAEKPDEKGKSASERLAEEAGKLMKGGRPKAQQDTTGPIGTATMSADGTITLNLHAHGSVVGEATISYGKDDKQYQEVKRHLNGIKPGEVKLVQPWSDQIKKQDIGGKPGDKPSDKDQPNDQPGDKPSDKTDPSDKTAPTPKLAPTTDFSRRVNDTYNQIPQNVRDALDKDNVQVVATDRVTDVMPELKGEKPRGWPPGSSWDDVDGAYDVGGKRIIVAERQGSPKSPNANNIEGLTRHETGHAVDHLKNFSDSKEFKDAYDREAAKIQKPDSETLKYFLQKGEAGRQEAFAEMFAINNGGATNTTREALIKKYFPDTLKVVADQTSKL